MKKPHFYLLLTLLMVGTLLAACGDNTATAVPTTTLAPTTTAAATTTIAPTTTVAPAGSVATVTPKPATTTATTTTTTTIAAKTTTVVPATTTTASRTGNSSTTVEELNFSQTPAGFTRFPLNASLLTYLKNQLKNDEVLGKDQTILKAFAVLGTDESSADVAGGKFDTTVRAMGFTFAITGYNSMLKLDTTLLGAYSKTGNPDLVIIGVPSPDFLDTSGGDPLPDDLANFAKGKKFIFVAISGTDIASIFTKQNNFPPGMPTVGTK